MSAKIIHIYPAGTYQRHQDIRTPRTVREAWGADVDIEKSAGLPRPYWHEWAAGVGVVVFILCCLAIARLISP